MKRMILLAALLSVIVMSTGCAFIVNGGADDEPVPAGMVFSSVRWTDKASPNEGGATKTGYSRAVGILGLIAFGDATVTKAADDAGVTEVYSVDHEFETILMLFNTYTTIVRGQ